MFTIDQNMTSQAIREKNMLKAFFSMNNHQVATPEMMLEDARSYIMFFEESGGKQSAYIGLHLLQSGRKMFYTHSSNPFRTSEMESVEDEAFGFLEGLGALLDSIDFKKRSSEEKDRWMDEQGIFCQKSEASDEEKPVETAAAQEAPSVQQEPQASQAPPAVPQSASRTQDPPQVQPAPHDAPQPPQVTPAPPMQDMPQSQQVAQEPFVQQVPPAQYVPQAPQPQQAAPEAGPPQDVPQAPSQPAAPAQFVPQAPQQPAPPDQRTPDMQTQNAPILQDQDYRGSDEDSFREAAVTEYESYPSAQKTSKKLPQQQAPLSDAETMHPKPSVRAAGSKAASHSASQKDREEIMQKAIRAGVVKSPKSSARREGPSGAGVVSRDREALARLLTSF